MKNTMDILYCTGIYLAAQNGHRDVVKYLSEMGYTPSEDVYKFTTFYMAAQNGLLNVIKDFVNDNFSFSSIIQVKSEEPILQIECNLMLNHNLVNSIFENILNIHNEDKDGNTCVHYAVMDGNEMFLNHLMKRGASLRAMNNNKDRPIHLAASKGFNHIVQFLVEQEVGVDVLNKNKDTPLHYAVQNNYTIVVKELLKHGAQNLRNTYGYLPIHYSTSEEIDILLKQDNDNDYKDEAGNSLLHIAVLNGHCDIIKKLIKSNLNIDDKNKNGNTALYLAAELGLETVVKMLVKNKACITSRNLHNWTPCHVAIDKKHDVALFLLEAASDSIPKSGSSLIHIAAKIGSKKLVQMLIKKGFYATDIVNDMTPLMFAAKNGHAEICEILLDRYTGIINSTNKYKKTALHYAASKNKVEVIKMLLKYEAKLLEDEDNNTPLNIAISKGFKNVKEILTKYQNALK